MATIDITFNTTDRQDARLAEILAYENAGRVADGRSGQGAILRVDGGVGDGIEVTIRSRI